jgi:hypothetical protein
MALQLAYEMATAQIIVLNRKQRPVGAAASQRPDMPTLPGRKPLRQPLARRSNHGRAACIRAATVHNIHAKLPPAHHRLLLPHGLAAPAAICMIQC